MSGCKPSPPTVVGKMDLFWECRLLRARVSVSDCCRSLIMVACYQISIAISHAEIEEIITSLPLLKVFLMALSRDPTLFTSAS